MGRVLFLDRDGVINQKAKAGEYITTWDEFRIRDGIVDVLIAAGELGYKNIVITNQQCVGKGIITAVQLDELHRRMVAELAARGATIDAVYYCPHLASDGCACRKPKPGLLYRAMSELRGDLAVEESYFVGDSESDILAGNAFGVPTIWLNEEAATGASAVPTHAVRRLHDVASIIRA